MKVVGGLMENLVKWRRMLLVGGKGGFVRALRLASCTATSIEGDNVRVLIVAGVSTGRGAPVRHARLTSVRISRVARRFAKGVGFSSNEGGGWAAESLATIVDGSLRHQQGQQAIFGGAATAPPRKFGYTEQNVRADALSRGSPKVRQSGGVTVLGQASGIVKENVFVLTEDVQAQFRQCCAHAGAWASEFGVNAHTGWGLEDPELNGNYEGEDGVPLVASAHASLGSDDVGPEVPELIGEDEDAGWLPPLGEDYNDLGNPDLDAAVMGMVTSAASDSWAVGGSAGDAWAVGGPAGDAWAVGGSAGDAWAVGGSAGDAWAGGGPQQ